MQRMAMKRSGFFVLGLLACVLLTNGIPRNVQPKVLDAVVASPQFYTVRLENARVRVLDYHLPAGQSEPMHKHQTGLAYVISGATLHTTMADGSVGEGTLNAGDVHWRDNVTHAVRNIGTTEMRALIVELK